MSTGDQHKGPELASETSGSWWSQPAFGDRFRSPITRTIFSVTAVIGLAGLGTLAAQWMRRPETTSLASIAPAMTEAPKDTLRDSRRTDEVVVHIVGAVRKPGMHTFPATTRLKTALTQVGVFSNADLSPFNLAAKLQDGTQISVPKRSAVRRGSTAGRSRASSTASPNLRPSRLSGRVAGLTPLPVPIPDAYAGVTARGYQRDGIGPDASSSSSASGSGSGSDRKRSGSGTSSGSSRKVAPSQPIDINRASVSELQRLPGVGPSLANAIIAYREAKGGFVSIDELDSVKGIGPKKLESLRPHVKL